ncbi:TolC family outer membrane protein [Microbulbifer variabilis]|uniref:TolC family outer membrane protein n=1 Tax=Microbulbifer variabilis TaxID=266805 RepID=UPI001CFC844D|nr:TolC family outer membrane protein [Microbulbifer variabilis]
MKRSNRKESRGRQLRPLKKLIAATLLGFGAMQAQADTLWDIYMQALDNDPQLAADRAAYHAGVEAKNQLRAPLLPQVNAFIEAKRRHQYDQLNQVAPIDVDPDENVDQLELVEFLTRTTGTTQDRTYNATLSQAIFDAPAWFGYQQGKKLTELATAEYSANQQDMMIRVATAYFDVLRAFDVLEAAVSEEKALAKQLEQTQQRFEVGLTAITDVYDSQAAYDSSVARRLTAQDSLLSNFDALSVLTGGYHDEVAPLVESFQVAPPVPADRADWVDFALANNFTLKASRLNAEAARYNARAAASEHLPTLTGSLSYNKFTRNGDVRERVMYENFPELEQDETFPLDLDNRESAAAISLNIPIYTGGLLSANRREARNLSFQAQDLRNLTERNTIQTTRTLHRAVVTDVSRVSARQQAVVSAKSALEATQAGYEVGTRNIVDVLLAQRTLFQSQTDYANALYDYILNTLSLKQVAGLLSPKDLQELDTMLNPTRHVSRVAEAGAAGPSK